MALLGTRSEVNIAGGFVGDGFDAIGGTVNITGGSVGDFFDAFFNGTVNISGGTIGSFFEALSVTGVIQDESGSTVNISGGVVGGGFDAGDGSTINISGGIVGTFAGGRFDANSGSTVNISGGTIGNGFFNANSGSTVNISGGSGGSNFTANSGSTVNISGGGVGIGLRANSGSTVNISGGTIGDTFVFDDGFEFTETLVTAEPGSTVNLFGTSFSLDGIELTGLVTNEPFVINNRDVTLTGLLADGSAIDFNLLGEFGFGEDFFAPDATLTVTIVEVAVAGDYNSDGVVNTSDFNLFVSTFGSTTDLRADGNLDGIVDAADYVVYRDNFGATSASALASGEAARAVPEPTGLLLLTLLTLIGLAPPRRTRTILVVS